MDRLKRIFALMLVILIAALIVVMVYLGFTGSKYFLASVYAALVFPLLVYAFLFIYRIFGGK